MVQHSIHTDQWHRLGGRTAHGPTATERLVQSASTGEMVHHSLYISATRLLQNPVPGDVHRPVTSASLPEFPGESTDWYQPTIGWARRHWSGIGYRDFNVGITLTTATCGLIVLCESHSSLWWRYALNEVPFFNLCFFHRSLMGTYIKPACLVRARGSNLASVITLLIWSCAST